MISKINFEKDNTTYDIRDLKNVEFSLKPSETNCKLRIIIMHSADKMYMIWYC